MGISRTPRNVNANTMAAAAARVVRPSYTFGNRVFTVAA